MKIKALVIDKDHPEGIVEEIENTREAIKERLGGSVSSMKKEGTNWWLHYTHERKAGDYFAISGRGFTAYGCVIITGDGKTDGPGTVPQELFDAPIPLLYRTPDEARAAGICV